MRMTQNSAKATLIVLCCLLMAAAQTSAQGPPSNEKTKTWSADKRYADNGDKTITDTKTGLMWVKMDSYLHTGHWVSWEETHEYVAVLNKEGFAGYFDWRLPTLIELKTLYDSEKINSSQVGREMKIHIDPIFAKNGGGAMWSSEVNGAFNAQGVIFNHGRSFSAPKKSKSRKAVRAVRIANN